MKLTKPNTATYCSIVGVYYIIVIDRIEHATIKNFIKNISLKIVSSFVQSFVLMSKVREKHFNELKKLKCFKLIQLKVISQSGKRTDCFLKTDFKLFSTKRNVKCEFLHVIYNEYLYNATIKKLQWRTNLKKLSRGLKMVGSTSNCIKI